MPGTRRNAMPRPMPQAAALRAVLKRCSTLVAAAATLSVCGRLVGAGPAVRFRFN